MPALSLGIFRIRRDKALGDVLQITFAGAPHGAISESSSCHLWAVADVLLSGRAGPGLGHRTCTCPFPNLFGAPSRAAWMFSALDSRVSPNQTSERTGDVFQERQEVTEEFG